MHRVGITRAHLEDDAAKLVHAGGADGRIAGADYSMVDFNRSGTALVEIVSEPDIFTPEQARAYLTQLRNLLEQLDVSDVNMEEGSLRCDANISVHRPGTPFGTRTELKNMNSFRFLQRGLEAEIERQILALEMGETIVQETVHFDPATGKVSTLRGKEEAHDYRYFPEPDLVPVELDAAYVERVRRHCRNCRRRAKSATCANSAFRLTTRVCFRPTVGSHSTSNGWRRWWATPSCRPTGSWATSRPI